MGRVRTGHKVPYEMLPKKITMCHFRKYPYPPHLQGRSLRNSEGRAPPQFSFKGKYEAKLEFWREWGLNQKKIKIFHGWVRMFSGIT